MGRGGAMSNYTGAVQDVETQRPVTGFDLESFRCQLVAFFEQHHVDHFPTLSRDPVTLRQGRKYTRFFKGTSIYCFVEMTTGDILKPASLKKVAKHSRGSIHNQDPLKCCGPYGVAYLR